MTTKYPPTGPFNPGAAPGLSAALFNNLEQYLGYVGDSNLSVDGNGNLTVASITLATGKIARVSFFGATGTGSAQTLNHGLGGTPDIVMMTYSGNFGSPPTHPPYWYNQTSTQVTCVADNGYFYYCLCFKLS